MKYLVLFGIGSLMGCLWLHAKVRESEVLISSNATLSVQGTELYPKEMLLTTGEWSEIFLELPGLHEENGALFTQNGKKLSVTGYLVMESGDRLPLDRIEKVEIADKTLLRLSSRALEWRKRNYRFKGIYLSATPTVSCGRVVWISYDPAATHTGFVVPDLLK